MKFCEKCGELYEFDDCPECGAKDKEVETKKEELAEAEEKAKPKAEKAKPRRKMKDPPEQPEPEGLTYTGPIQAKFIKKLLKKSERLMVKIYDDMTWVSNGHWMVVAPTEQFTTPLVYDDVVFDFKSDASSLGGEPPEMKSLKIQSTHQIQQEFQHGMMVKLAADGTDRYLYADGTGRHTAINAYYIDGLAAMVKIAVGNLPCPCQDDELGPVTFSLGKVKLVVMPMRLD